MAYKQIRRRTRSELGQTEGATPEVSHAPEVSQIQTDRDLMTADDALALQGVVGNRAVTQLTGAASPSAPPRIGYIQSKPIPPQPLRPESSPHEPAYAHLRRKQTLQRADIVSPIVHSTQAPSTVIQPARGRFGRVLGSLFSLGSGAAASAMTYGFEGDRTDKNAGFSNKVLSYSTDQDISVTTSGTTLTGKKYTPTNQYAQESGNGKAVLLLSGSGGSNISQLRPVADNYCRMGSTVYALDYRGYGESDDNGMLSEKGFNNDALAMFNYVTSDSGLSSTSIVIHGFSLGGAIAAKLVKTLTKQGKKVGGLVLHSAIDSAYKAARDQIGIPVLGQLAGAITKGAAGNFDTRAKIKELAKLDPSLPLHLMSGKGENGDQLGLDVTGLDKFAQKEFGKQAKKKGKTDHVSSAISNRGDHLGTHRHMENQTNMDSLKTLLESTR